MFLLNCYPVKYKFSHVKNIRLDLALRHIHTKHDNNKDNDKDIVNTLKYRLHKRREILLIH